MKKPEELFIGLQHIGIPTADVDKTISFFEQFGFKVDWRKTESAEDDVAFLSKGSCVIETYFSKQPSMTNGAVDHIAIDVSDIEKVYEYVSSLGYTAIEGEIKYLPFFEHGVKYFTILGVNNEKVEFNQRL